VLAVSTIPMRLRLRSLLRDTISSRANTVVAPYRGLILRTAIAPAGIMDRALLQVTGEQGDINQAVNTIIRRVVVITNFCTPGALTLSILDLRPPTLIITINSNICRATAISILEDLGLMI
jgi:hypothetical protein